MFRLKAEVIDNNKITKGEDYRGKIKLSGLNDEDIPLFIKTDEIEISLFTHGVSAEDVYKTPVKHMLKGDIEFTLPSSITEQLDEGSLMGELSVVYSVRKTCKESQGNREEGIYPHDNYLVFNVI